MGGILGNPMKSVMEENMKKQFKFQEETMLKQVSVGTISRFMSSSVSLCCLKTILIPAH